MMRWAVCVLAASLVVGCGGDGPTGAGTVAEIAIRGAVAEMRSGETRQLRLVGLNSRGDSVRTSTVVWSSSNNAVAYASPSGNLAAQLQGRAWIRASVDGHHDSVLVTVRAWLDIEGSDSIAIGDVVSLGRVFYVNGPRAEVTATLSSLSDSTVLRFNGGGRPRAVGAGRAWIVLDATTESGVVRDSVEIQVTLRPSMPDVRVMRIAVGDRHTCGLTPAGAAYCFGENILGELGIGCTYNECPDASRLISPVLGGHAFVELDVGSRTSCGIRADGMAFCWGDNGQGEAGQGATTPQILRTPVAVATTARFTRVAIGPHDTTCMLSTDGTPWCFGNNDEGQGGRTPEAFGDARVEPIANAPTGMTSIDVGVHHACAVGSAGTWCWGYAPGYGVVRDPPDLAMRIASELTFTQVIAGFDWTCAVSSDGTAYCWGLGVSSPTPVAPGHRFKKIARGGGIRCGITTTDRLYCWGSGILGALGNLWTASSETPLEVWPGRKFADLSMSDVFVVRVCAVDTLGFAYCW